jgi:hypothetical protein
VKTLHYKNWELRRNFQSPSGPQTVYFKKLFQRGRQGSRLHFKKLVLCERNRFKRHDNCFNYLLVTSIPPKILGGNCDVTKKIHTYMLLIFSSVSISAKNFPGGSTIVQLGKDSQVRADRKGQPGQDSQDGTSRNGLPA